MPGSKRPNVIDGFTSVQAARRAGQAARHLKTQSSRTALPVLENKTDNEQPADSEKVGREPRIGHTAIPEKFEINCYQCGYGFTIQGLLKDTYCPKCKKLLKVANHVIESEQTEDIMTIGLIEVTKGGIVRGARLVARQVKLAGDVRNCAAIECKLLEINGPAHLDITKIQMQNLRIAQKCRIKINQRIDCADVAILGTLNGDVYATGTVTVKPGGCLRGELHGHRLIVEDGAKMNARLCIEPIRHKRD